MVTPLPQFAPVVGDAGAERQKSLDLLTKLTKKKEVLDVKKATNAHLAAEQAKYIQSSVLLTYMMQYLTLSHCSLVILECTCMHGCAY